MKLIGTITTSDGTSKNNSNTTAFSLPPKFLIQPTVDVYVNQGTASTVAATSADLKIPADAIIEIELVPGHSYLAMIPVSGAGSASVKVAIR